MFWIWSRHSLNPTRFSMSTNYWSRKRLSLFSHQINQMDNGKTQIEKFILVLDKIKLQWKSIGGLKPTTTSYRIVQVLYLVDLNWASANWKTNLALSFPAGKVDMENYAQVFVLAFKFSVGPCIHRAWVRPNTHGIAEMWVLMKEVTL